MKQDSHFPRLWTYLPMLAATNFTKLTRQALSTLALAVELFMTHTQKAVVMVMRQVATA